MLTRALIARFDVAGETVELVPLADLYAELDADWP
jgi:hypothetical protein